MSPSPRRDTSRLPSARVTGSSGCTSASHSLPPRAAVFSPHHAAAALPGQRPDLWGWFSGCFEPSRRGGSRSQQCSAARVARGREGTAVPALGRDTPHDTASAGTGVFAIFRRHLDTAPSS